MSRSSVRRGVAVALLAGAVFAGCGDDDADAEASEPAAEESTTTTTEATTTTMSAEESEAAISEKTTEFFALVGTGEFEAAVELLENGDEYLEELAHCADLVDGVTVEMKTVDITDDTAMTTYDIVIGGEVLLADSGGTAVMSDGEWLVGENTFLSLYDAAKESCTGPVPADA